jgi:hypothetical protein
MVGVKERLMRVQNLCTVVDILGVRKRGASLWLIQAQGVSSATRTGGIATRNRDRARKSRKIFVGTAKVARQSQVGPHCVSSVLKMGYAARTGSVLNAIPVFGSARVVYANTVSRMGPPLSHREINPSSKTSMQETVISQTGLNLARQLIGLRVKRPMQETLLKKH